MAGGSWKVAYADFMTAMMAFFLLMWLLGAVPEEKRAELAGYFNDPGGYQTNSTIIDYTAPPPAGLQNLTEDLTPAELQNLAINRFLQDQLKDQIVQNKTRLSPSEAGVLLRTSDAMPFAPGSTDLGPDGEKMLNAVIETMRRFKVHLHISGHTDSAETGAPRFQNKWELSAARAAAVTSYIVERGGINPSLIQSASYANYRPLVPDTPDAPNPVNRRVEFFFFSPDTRPANLGF